MRIQLIIIPLICTFAIGQNNNCSKKDLVIISNLISNNIVLTRTLVISDSSITVHDTDSLNNVCRVFLNETWTTQNYIDTNFIAIDYLFDSFYFRRTEQLTLIRLGHGYSIKKANGDLYHVSFNYLNDFWEGEIQCIENVLVAARLTKKLKYNDGYKIVSHENLLVKKIKKKKRVIQ